MKAFLIGLILGLIALPAGAYVYLSLGLAPVATSAPPLPFERFITQMALHARVDKEMPKKSPMPGTDDNEIAGATVYRENCAVCHGLMGQAETAIPNGMFPKPPQLLGGDGVTDDPPGETYWKVANGIRLTGMPGFNKSLTQDQMWQVSLLLANADKLPAKAKDTLSQPASPR